VIVDNALDETFRRARTQNRGLLMPYLTGGFPDRDAFVELAVAVLEAGADVLELGVPFSDPLLDGPSNQRAQQMALEAGITPSDCLDFAREIGARSKKPVLLMGAVNPIFAYGLKRFCADAQEAGVSGLIIPDLPFEETDELRSVSSQYAQHVIHLVAPTSTSDRLRGICAQASGFVYCISVSGVTGVRFGLAEAVRPLVTRVRACTDVPVAVGFGISGPDQVRDVIRLADGAIVGSALTNVLHETSPTERTHAVTEFISALANAAHGVQ
jgi:tryptophan synthase alpha chain